MTALVLVSDQFSPYPAWRSGHDAEGHLWLADVSETTVTCVNCGRTLPEDSEIFICEDDDRVVCTHDVDFRTT